MLTAGMSSFSVILPDGYRTQAHLMETDLPMLFAKVSSLLALFQTQQSNTS
jgi:hypothetical protein